MIIEELTPSHGCAGGWGVLDVLELKENEFQERIQAKEFMHISEYDFVLRNASAPGLRIVFPG